MSDIIIASVPLIFAFAVSVFRYRKLEPKTLRFFPWFLAFTFTIQATGYFYSHISHKSNHFIFNAYTFIEYGFYLLILSRFVIVRLSGIIVRYVLIAFNLFYLYAVFWKGSFFVYSALTCNVGEIMTLFCCMLYFVDLLVADEMVDMFSLPMFWITTGIMIAVIGDFLYLSFFDFIIKDNLDPAGDIYFLITTATSILEYSLFSIGFMQKRAWIKIN